MFCKYEANTTTGGSSPHSSNLCLQWIQLHWMGDRICHTQVYLSNEVPPATFIEEYFIDKTGCRLMKLLHTYGWHTIKNKITPTCVRDWNRMTLASWLLSGSVSPTTCRKIMYLWLLSIVKHFLNILPIPLCQPMIFSFERCDTADINVWCTFVT